MPALVEVIEAAASDVAAGKLSRRKATRIIAATDDGQSLTRLGARDLLTMEINRPGSVREAYMSIIRAIIRSLEDQMSGLHIQHISYHIQHHFDPHRPKRYWGKLPEFALGVLAAAIVHRRNRRQWRNR